MTKINILLDIDNTLLNSQESSSFNLEYEKKKKKYNRLRKHVIEGYYEVFERPYLEEFLNFIFKNFNVFIWTAASEEYADFVVKNIIKNNKIKGVLHSDHCDKSAKYSSTKSIKDLSLLWDGRNKLRLRDDIIKLFKKDNTIIIDDYKEEVYIKNKDNCILAPVFDYENDDCYKDEFLLNLKDTMKRALNEKRENRDIIKRILKVMNPSNTRKHKSGSGKHGTIIKKSKRKNVKKSSKVKKSIKSRNKTKNKSGNSSRNRLITKVENKESVSRIAKILENIRKSSKRVIKSRKSRR